MCFKTGFIVAVVLLSVASAEQKEEKIEITELDVPKHPKRDTQVKLICKYDLKGYELESISWFFNNTEFFRYAKDDEDLNPRSVFPRLEFDVNREQSDDHTVTLENIKVNASGSYSCKVRTKPPNVLLAQKQQYMEVVVIPEQKPTLKYDKEDNKTNVMTINCTTAPSNPEAKIIFKVNGRQVKDEHIERYPANLTRDGLIISKATLHLRPNRYMHADGKNMSKVECISQIRTFSQISDMDVFNTGEHLIGSFLLMLACIVVPRFSLM